MGQTTAGTLAPEIKIAHHLDDATLMSLVAGSLHEALERVAQAHVEVCVQCRKELRLMREIGQVLMEQGPATVISKPAPVKLLRKPEADEVGIAAAVAESPLSLVTRLIDGPLESVRWQWLAPGVWHRPIELGRSKAGDLRLLKVAPGSSMPEHGHGGAELTLVLDGAYTDHLGRFAAGDVADLDPDTEHNPVADKSTGCICLIASETPARFKSWIARLVQPLTGI